MAKKVLVVDDSEDIRSLIQEVLEDNGIEVQIARDGQEALDVLKGGWPNLIILDVVMPNMDGYSFLKTIKTKASEERIPIVVLTGKDKLEDFFRVEGVAEFLVKPFSEKQLLSIVTKHLEFGG